MKETNNAPYFLFNRIKRTRLCKHTTRAYSVPLAKLVERLERVVVTSPNWKTRLGYFAAIVLCQSDVTTCVVAWSFAERSAVRSNLQRKKLKIFSFFFRDVGEKKADLGCGCVSVREFRENYQRTRSLFLLFLSLSLLY